MTVENLVISIIIPTFNKAQILQATLESLVRQSIPADRFEVIVVDDGSTDHTWDVVRDFGDRCNCFLLHQTHDGPTAARNLAAARASGEVLLFLDDDVIASPQLVGEHLRSHQDHDGVLVLGRRRPEPAAYTTLFDKILDFESVLDLGEEEGLVPFHAASTQNMSIKQEHFRLVDGFDEGLKSAEDIDLAYRAAQLGLEILYNPRAVGYHNHPRTLDQRCQQLRWYAMWMPQFYGKHPELRGQIPVYRDKEPIDWRQDSLGLVLRKMIRLFLVLPPCIYLTRETIRFLEDHWSHPRLLHSLYWKLLNGYRAIGFRDGLRGMTRTGLQRYPYTHNVAEGTVLGQH